MKNWIAGLVLAAGLSAGLPVNLSAADTTVTAFSPFAGEPELSLTSDQPDIATRFTIRNTAAVEFDAVLQVTDFSEEKSASTVPATWALIGADGKTDLSTTATTPKKLAAGEYTAILTANLAKPGNYAATLRVFNKDGSEETHYTVKIVRPPQALADSSFIKTDGVFVHEIRDPATFFGSKVDVTTPLISATGKELQFKTATVVEATRKLDTAAFEKIDAKAMGCFAGEPETAATATPCTIKVNFPALSSAGEYLVKLRVADADGGTALSQFTVLVRAHWVYAVLMLGLGASLGWWVRTWRTRDHAVSTALLGLAQAMDQIKLLEPQGDENLALVAALSRQASDLQARLYFGEETDTAKADALLTRTSAIQQWLACDAAYGQLVPDEQTRLRDARKNLLRSLRATPAVDSEIATNLQAFKDVLEGAQERNPYWKVVQDLRTANQTDLDAAASQQPNAALATAAKAALEALTNAEALLAAPSTDLTKIESAIKAAQQAIADFRKLSPARQQALETLASNADLLTPVTSIPNVPFAVNADASTIRSAIKRRNWWTNFAVFGVVLLGGYYTLGTGNLTWGAPADWIAAFFAGAGLQFGFGTAASDLLTQLGKK